MKWGALNVEKNAYHRVNEYGGTWIGGINDMALLEKSMSLIGSYFSGLFLLIIIGFPFAIPVLIFLMGLGAKQRDGVNLIALKYPKLWFGLKIYTGLYIVGLIYAYMSF